MTYITSEDPDQERVCTSAQSKQDLHHSFIHPDHAWCSYMDYFGSTLIMYVMTSLLIG